MRKAEKWENVGIAWRFSWVRLNHGIREKGVSLCVSDRTKIRHRCP